jgi:hypothetical protein
MSVDDPAPPSTSADTQTRHTFPGHYRRLQEIEKVCVGACRWPLCTGCWLHMDACLRCSCTRPLCVAAALLLLLPCSAWCTLWRPRAL